MQGQGDITQAVLPVEAEAFCHSLQIFEVKNIGSSGWSRQHEKIEKLNMQAIINATAQENEFVKEFLINEEKFPVLIHQLMATEIWKEFVFPKLVEKKFEPKITFPLYMVLYHEATLVNLLETTLYYQESCEACGDAILDLIDYCHRKLIWLTSTYMEKEEQGDDSSKAHGSSMQELITQAETLKFEMSLKTLSILRYICDHLSVLPLSCATRILNTQDFPVLLVELMQNPVWVRTSDKTGKQEKYIDNKWCAVADSDRFKLTKIEGQMWLTLYKLLMDPECQRKYELDPTRKNTLLKLRSHLNEIMLDQLPILADLHQYLERLSMMDPPPAKRDLVLEQMPEIREALLKSSGSWNKIADFQIKSFWDPSDDTLREQAKRWADTYNDEALQNLITEPPKCAVCGEPAAQRCSRCHNEWYCRRECQVKAWKQHKKVCDLLQETTRKLAQQTIST